MTQHDPLDDARELENGSVGDARRGRDRSVDHLTPVVERTLRADATKFYFDCIPLTAVVFIIAGATARGLCFALLNSVGLLVFDYRFVKVTLKLTVFANEMCLKKKLDTYFSNCSPIFKILSHLTPLALSSEETSVSVGLQTHKHTKRKNKQV